MCFLGTDPWVHSWWSLTRSPNKLHFAAMEETRRCLDSSTFHCQKLGFPSQGPTGQATRMVPHGDRFEALYGRYSGWYLRFLPVDIPFRSWFWADCWLMAPCVSIDRFYSHLLCIYQSKQIVTGVNGVSCHNVCKTASMIVIIMSSRVSPPSNFTASNPNTCLEKHIHVATTTKWSPVKIVLNYFSISFGGPLLSVYTVHIFPHLYSYRIFWGQRLYR